MSDQFLVRGVVDGLDAGDVRDELGLMAMNVFDEFGLGVGWARDQDRLHISQCCGNAVEIVLILGGFSRPDTVGFVVKVLRRIVGMEHEVVDTLTIEMKDARFAMIDPDDGVVMAGHLIGP